MPILAPCTFREHAKTYFLDPGELEILAGDKVVAETSRGLQVGVVKFRPRPMEDDKVVPPIRPILRLATTEDLQHDAENREQEDAALNMARERIIHFELDMKPIKAEIMLDRSKMYLFYESE